MGKPLEELEQELQECASAQNHLDALDIYEEIQRAGWTKPEHLVGMGHCLLKLRRRQDARAAWFKAIQMAPDHPAAVQALNDQFPGWRKDLPKPAPPPPVVTPPPAAPPPPRPAQAKTFSESTINWDYVMEDVAMAKAMQAKG